MLGTLSISKCAALTHSAEVVEQGLVRSDEQGRLAPRRLEASHAREATIDRTIGLE
ncbi:MAG: hypothetical protein WBA29_18910 [Xanthobacteraceae bacterium]